MAAASSKARQSTAAPMPPADVAKWTLWAFVILNLIIVNYLFLTAEMGENSILSFARFFGAHAALLMLFQLLLVARLPWLDRRIGMDQLTGWHRWVGFTLLWTILTHAALIIFGYAILDHNSLAKTFFALSGVPASLLGMLAAVVFVAIAATSTRSLRKRLRYETWHALHLLLYLGLGLSFVHQLQETTTFTSSTFARFYWLTLWVFTFGALVIGRIALPIWRNFHHNFRVASVVVESENVVSVYVTGRHLDQLSAAAGQFFIWRFPGYNHWWLANPYSLSIAPNGESLRLSAKAVGVTSASLRDIPVGARAILEGPYGAFTSLHRSRPGLLLIAGGMGITPIRSLLEEQQAGDVIVLYRARSESEAVLIAEIRELVRARNGKLHLLTGKTGENAASFDSKMLCSLVPDIADRDVYVCGPSAMTLDVLDALRSADVPNRQVHAEKFYLA
ncbi:ferredoxin reductase family protein [Streptomyces sp. NPDC055109]